MDESPNGHRSRPVSRSRFAAHDGPIFVDCASAPQRVDSTALPGRGDPLEVVTQRRNADLEAVFLFDRRSGGTAQWRERRRVVEHAERRLGQAIDVEKRLDQAVLARLDHFAHGRNVRGQHDAAARHRIQQRPRENERRRQVDVQVAQPEDRGQLLGQDPAGEDESVEIVALPAQDPFLEARRLPVCSLSQP